MNLYPNRSKVGLLRDCLRIKLLAIFGIILANFSGKFRGQYRPGAHCPLNLPEKLAQKNPKIARSLIRRQSLRQLFFFFFFLIFSLFVEAYEILEREYDEDSLVEIVKLRLDNHLEVKLTSDPSVSDSAIALSVETGSWEDPDKFSGMAHFLEHLLFMGSVAYPDEADFSRYLSDHQGMCNAFTDYDRTVYYFSISHQGFQGALERFSHFFLDPLFSTSTIKREMYAIDEEFGEGVQSDYRRFWRIFKETGNPSHPNARFSIGNLNSLCGIEQNDLKTWFAEHYTSEKMHLAIVSSFSIEEQIELVVQNFSSIVSSQNDKFFSLHSLLSEEQKGSIIYMTPVKNRRIVELLWEIPQNLIGVQEREVVEFISYILEHEGQGSLSDQLKKEGLIESVAAYMDKVASSRFLFSIVLSMTEKGIEKIDEVILRCFQAINLIKKEGIPLYFIQEIREQKSRRREEEKLDKSSLNIVLREVEEMIDHQVIEELTLNSSVNRESETLFMDSLKPNSCVFFVMADPKLTKINPNIIEKWTGAEYLLRPLSKQVFADIATKPFHEALSFPLANPFFKTQSIEVVDKEQDPIKLEENQFRSSYLIQTPSFKNSDFSLILRIYSPYFSHLKNQLLLEIYLKAFRDQISSLLFYTAYADLEWSIEFNEDHLSFIIDLIRGSEKVCLIDPIQKFKTLALKEKEFENYKKILLDQLSNPIDSIALADEAIAKLFQPNFFSRKEKHQILSKLTFSEFLLFSKFFLRKAYTESLLLGAIYEVEANDLWMNLKSILNIKNYPKNEKTSSTIDEFPNEEGLYIIKEEGELKNDAALLLLDQGAYSPETKAVQILLSSVLTDAFFHALRTEQQTAYSTYVREFMIADRLVQSFGVQSRRYSSEDLLKRFEMFLDSFVKEIKQTIPKKRFILLKSHYRQDEAKTFGKKFAKIDRFAEDLEDEKEIVHYLSHIEYEKFIEIATQFLSKKGQRRIAILIKGKK